MALIIYIGFSLIGKINKRKKKVSLLRNDHTSQFDSASYDTCFSAGDHEYKEKHWKVKPMELQNLAGSYYFDFTKADIPEAEIPIKINSWAAEVQMLLPVDIEFRVDATVNAGEINILGQTVSGINRDLYFESPEKNITLNVRAGSIRID